MTRPAPPNVLDPALYLRIKAKIHANLRKRALSEGHPVRWGAYHSSMLSRMYKSAGGRYSPEHPSSRPTGITRWHAEKWIDICRSDPPRTMVPCGRSDPSVSSSSRYPVCRPSVRVSRETPTTYEEMDKTLITRICRDKAKHPDARLPVFRRRRKAV